LTSLFIVFATICSSVYLLAFYMPVFGSITDDAPQRHVSNIDLVLIRENVSCSEIFVYNLGEEAVQLTEVMFDNMSVPFIVQHVNRTLSTDNILLPDQLSIVVVRQLFSQHQTIYLKSYNQIVEYYVKGR
jgi:hypothetical protein